MKPIVQVVELYRDGARVDHLREAGDEARQPLTDRELDDFGLFLFLNTDGMPETRELAVRALTEFRALRTMTHATDRERIGHMLEGAGLTGVAGYGQGPETQAFITANVNGAAITFTFERHSEKLASVSSQPHQPDTQPLFKQAEPSPYEALFLRALGHCEALPKGPMETETCEIIAALMKVIAR